MQGQMNILTNRGLYQVCYYPTARADHCWRELLKAVEIARYDNLRPLTPSVCHTGPRTLHSPQFSSILPFPLQRTEALNKEGILSFSKSG